MSNNSNNRNTSNYGNTSNGKPFTIQTVLFLAKFLEPIAGPEQGSYPRLYRSVCLLLFKVVGGPSHLFCLGMNSRLALPQVEAVEMPGWVRSMQYELPSYCEVWHFIFPLKAAATAGTALLGSGDEK